VTQHRFIRGSPSTVLDAAHLGHRPNDSRAFDTIQHWRRPAESERGQAVHWYDHVPGIGEVGCCLSVEGGANGALAHLTTSLPARQGASSPRRALPRPLLQLALSSWSHRKLVGLARLAEAYVAQAGEAGKPEAK
jgi:hypothetical protein